MILLAAHPTQEALIDKNPYAGAQGKLLLDLLKKANLPHLELIYLWEEFPKGGRITQFFETKKELKDPQTIDRIYEKIKKLGARLVIPLGGTALWALSGSEGIKDARGYLSYDKTNSFKILPTYEPGAVIKNYSHRYAVINDFRKAQKHDSPDPIRRPTRTVQLHESPQDLRGFYVRLKKSILDGSIRHFGVDIETHIDLQQISCISFAISSQEAHVVPLLRASQPPLCKRTIWSEETEAQILALIQMILALPCPKYFHNATFDTSHLANNQIFVTQVEDTMIKAHSQQPEILKSLGFLGSIATNERQWKKMRQRAKDEEKDED